MRLPHSYYSQLLLFHFVIQTRGTHVVGTGFSQTEVYPNLYNDNSAVFYLGKSVSQKQVAVHIHKET